MFNNNLLMGAASAGGTSLVEVGNSALFDSANSEYLSRTPSSAGNRDTWTISYWVYKTYVTGAKAFFTAGSNNTNVTELRDQGTGILEYRHQDGGSVTDNIITTAIFRDIGWYHIVWAVDTTQAVASSRIILYVNGERITDFSTANYPAQNADTDVNATVPTNIGARTGPDQHWSGYMAEAVLIDGLQLTPTSFGQYDSTGTFWTPLSSATIKGLTFGTNGFYLDNTTNAETDASGEGNNFTNNNTVTLSTHTPTNLFSTLNPLMSGSTGTFSSGNRTATLPPTNTSVISSMAIPSTGKWYCEFRFATIHGYAVIGVGQMDASSWLVNGASYFSATPAFTEEGTLFTQGTTSGDAITVTTDTTYGAMWDADNSILKITDGTDTFQCAFTVNDTSVPLGFQFAISSGSVTGNVSVNFGDPPFAISSSNTDGNGQGSFEFAPPSGYLALNTANLASETTRTKSNLEEYFSTTLYEGNGEIQRVGQFLPFTNSFTVGKGALLIGANSEDLSRGSMSGTATTFTISMWVKRAEPAVGSATANFMFTTASDAGLSFGNNSTADVLAWYSGSYTSTTRVFNDQSSWMNVVFKSSSGTGTAYVNGCLLYTSPSPRD